jgi:AcrR family transcriptional regulator
LAIPEESVSKWVGNVFKYGELCGDAGTVETLEMPTRRHELEQPPGDPLLAARIGRAALEACGEVGYPKLTVEKIIDRASVSRAAFYRLYDSKADCFAKAYAAEADVLVARVLASCRSASEWKQGLDAALAELNELATADPLLANALVAQVRIAGGPAMDKRSDVLKTLAAAMDAARSESPHSPPAIAASFVVGGIEGALLEALVRGAPAEFAKALPALRFIALAAFFGPEAARDQDGADQ